MKIHKENIKELKYFTELNEEDKKHLFCKNMYINEFIKKDNIIYHKKHTSLERIVNELLNEMISDYFELKTVHSTLYKDDNCLYLLNKLFTNKNNKYSYLDDILFPNLSLHDSLYNLDKLNLIYDSEYNKKYTITNKSCEELKLNLKKLVVRDFITMLSDRWSANIIFEYDKSNIKLMPVFDYEMSFKQGSENPYINIIKMNLYNDKDIEYIKNDIIFQQLLEKAMLINMKEFFSKLKEKHNIKLSSNEKWDYENIIKERKNTIKSYKLIK